MKQRPRIYYTEEQKALMWDRWQKGESLRSIAQLFDRNHSSVQGIFIRTGGEIVWRKTLGTIEDLGSAPPLKLGTPSFGGPIITAGGLVFIGATMDNYLRALDVSDGSEIWKGRLPAGGQATPMTYEWQGRQYVVIYAGGNARAEATLGDSVVAFALSED